MNITDLLKNIDKSKMETKGVSFYEMCESEFEIYEWIEQPKEKERLTYCYFHRWICTDTEVGIRVWYFDNEAVCISWQPYRKSDETFGWISKDCFYKVKEYAESLVSDRFSSIDIITDEHICSVISEFEKIDYKKHEIKNTLARY